MQQPPVRFSTFRALLCYRYTVWAADLCELARHNYLVSRDLRYDLRDMRRRLNRVLDAETRIQEIYLEEWHG